MLKDSSEYNSWGKDLSESTKVLQANELFLKDEFFSCEEIYSAEDSDNPALKAFDIYSGVDLIVRKKGHLFGVASRMQPLGSFDTFTIREKRYTGAKTELEKRKEAIEIGAIYPKWTMQGYYEKPSTITSLGICKTVDLYEFIDKYPDLVQRRYSDNVFLVVKWSAMKAKGYNLKVFKAPENDLWLFPPQPLA